MNVESQLRKDGIEVIGRLDTLSINTIAKNVAEKICKAFPQAHFIPAQLFIEFSRIPMYIVKMPEGFAEANYFYKNSSIYFKQGLDVKDLEKFAVHELIHYMQEVKDAKGTLYRLGLCEYGEFKTYGMALNEGAVQLATAKVLRQPIDIVKYYDIFLPTTSPNCYPLLCNLVAQLAYLTGEPTLFDSTLFGTDTFKLSLINLCGKKQFLKIQDNLDKLLNIEEKIILLSNKLLQSDCEWNKAQKIAQKITVLKNEVKNTFIETQNLIFTSYFDNEFLKIQTTQEITIYRTRLYDYKNCIGITDNYNTFNDYYINKMMDLENLHESMTNNVALVVVKENKIGKLFKSLRNLFSLNKESQRN